MLHFVDHDITLRPASPADEPFLYQVYMSTRLEELASLPWDEAQRQAFLTMQFAAQRHHYHTQYNDASFEVILCDGEPSGRLYVARWPEEIRIIDIALAPAYRGRGVGTALITSSLSSEL